MEKLTEVVVESSTELIEVDIHLLCRMCGNISEDLIPIFEDASFNNEIPKRIEEYIPFINVLETDILPRKICIQCVNTLITWHTFIVCCSETNIRFQNMIKESEDLTFHDEIIESIDVIENTLEYLHEGEEEECKISEDCKDNCSNDESYAVSISKDEQSSSFVDAEEEMIEETRQNRFLKSTLTSQCSKSEDSLLCNIKTNSIDTQDSDLFNKLKIILTPKKGKYECSDCNYLTNKKACIEKHLIENHNEYDSSTLKSLRPNFKVDKKLAEDNKIIINDKTFYKCPECQKQLYTLYTFSWHMRIHSGERHFICYLCGKAFRVYQGLSRHIKQTHEKCKDFSCDICDRKFANRRNVIEHRRLHTNERPYSCQECNKTFKQKASLFIHKRCHLTTFQFKCEKCDQGFRSKGQMKVHLTLHSGEKSHECNICQRKFRIKHELNRHKLIHSDLKPFSCDKCSSTFRQKRYLLKHFKNYHAVKLDKATF